jgi:selenocysteine-specific elongation factor
MSGPLTLGTAGHIDHGKTVLVEALTGTNTDRLPEERARGISIELGFASLELPSGRSLSLVDVPGHERFVRTMVAGATGIDLFLLVVAADDGVMPQTREHLAVLEMLRVPAGVVAVTKSDLADGEGVELAAAEVRELLAGGPYEETEVVPVSARKGEGLERLVEALDRAAALRRREAEDGPARLHVDRSFSLRGVGTVVTGTLWSGVLGAGEEVRIEPAGRRARVRRIEVHGQLRERAERGQRVALNLAGVDRREVQRGDVVAGAGADLRPTYLIDAAVELVPGARPLRRGMRLHLHHGTREAPARVAPIEADLIEPGSRSYVQLRLERPIVPAAGDRFVLRQLAPPDTIGGGSVVDPASRKHGAGSRHVERLRLLESGDVLAQLEARLAGTVSGLGASEADPALLDQLGATGRAHRVGRRAPRYFAPAQLGPARARLLTALEELGSSGRPSSAGALADAAGLSDAGARALLEDLVAAGDVLGRGPGFVRASANAADPRGDRIVALLRDDGLEPRSIDALAAALSFEREEVRELLERLALEGRLVRVKPGVYYDPSMLSEAERGMVEICDRDGFVTIAGLRDELGTSRKYAQALLEHFDARRLTLRRGDRHVLRRGRASSGPVR